MTAKVIRSMPVEEYYAYPAWNASRLKALANSYLAYESYEGAQKSGGRTTQAMEFGHGVHAMVLEGIEPTGRNRDSILKACSMLEKNNEAKKLLSVELTEFTVIWRDDVWGECKARFDAFNAPMRAIVDLKVMAAGGHDPMKFGYAAVKFGYDLQAAWYTRAAKAAGLPVDHFYFVVLEKGWYDSSVLKAPQGMIEAGEDEIEFARMNLENATTNKLNGIYFGGRFPGVYDVEHRFYTVGNDCR